MCVKYFNCKSFVYFNIIKHIVIVTVDLTIIICQQASYSEQFVSRTWEFLGTISAWTQT